MVGGLHEREHPLLHVGRGVLDDEERGARPVGADERGRGPAVGVDDLDHASLVLGVDGGHLGHERAVERGREAGRDEPHPDVLFGGEPLDELGAERGVGDVLREGGGGEEEEREGGEGLHGRAGVRVW